MALPSWLLLPLILYALLWFDFLFHFISFLWTKLLYYLKMCATLPHSHTPSIIFRARFFHHYYTPPHNVQSEQQVNIFERIIDVFYSHDGCCFSPFFLYSIDHNIWQPGKKRTGKWGNQEKNHRRTSTVYIHVRVSKWTARNIYVLSNWFFFLFLMNHSFRFHNRISWIHALTCNSKYIYPYPFIDIAKEPNHSKHWQNILCKQWLWQHG